MGKGFKVQGHHRFKIKKLLKGTRRESYPWRVYLGVIWRNLNITGDCWDPAGTPGLAAPRHFRGTAKPVVTDATKPLKTVHTSRFLPARAAPGRSHKQQSLPQVGGLQRGGSAPWTALQVLAAPKCQPPQGSCALVGPHFTKRKIFC